MHGLPHQALDKRRLHPCVSGKRVLNPVPMPLEVSSKLGSSLLKMSCGPENRRPGFWPPSSAPRVCAILGTCTFKCLLFGVPVPLNVYQLRGPGPFKRALPPRQPELGRLLLQTSAPFPARIPTSPHFATDCCALSGSHLLLAPFTTPFPLLSSCPRAASALLRVPPYTHTCLIVFGQFDCRSDYFHLPIGEIACRSRA